MSADATFPAPVDRPRSPRVGRSGPRRSSPRNDDEIVESDGIPLLGASSLTIGPVEIPRASVTAVADGVVSALIYRGGDTFVIVFDVVVSRPIELIVCHVTCRTNHF